MQVSAAPPVKADVPLNPGPAPAGTVGPVRRNLAVALRDIGAGFNEASDNMGVQADKAMIYPVDAAYGVANILNSKTKNMPKIVHKVASVAGSGLGFVSAYYGLIVGGMLRTPGQVIRDTANSIADKVDGQKSFHGDFGYSGGLNPGSVTDAVARATAAANGDVPAVAAPATTPAP